MATLAAFSVGFVLSWTVDRLILRRLIDDRMASITLGCGLCFVMMMAAATFYLTRNGPVPDGPIIIPPFGYALSFVVGLLFVGILRVWIYSRHYQHSDVQEVFEPDWYDHTIFDQQVVEFDDLHAGKNYLLRHWIGQLPLPLSYWVNGLLLSVLILASAEWLNHRIRTDWGSLQALAVLALVYLAVSAIVWIWSSVGIWRSAYWHRRRGGSPGWGLAARALVVVGALATVFRSGDIALQAAELGSLATGRDSLGEIATMSVSPDGRDLILRGHLALGAADRFEQLLSKSAAVKQVVLTSPGGRMIEAERISDAVRSRGLVTRVDDYCMSACTDVLLAGRERTAPNRARIGFHQPSFPGLNEVELRGATEEMRESYLAAGVDPAFVWRAMSTPAEGMWFPSPDELIGAGVLTSTDFVVSSRGSGKRKRGSGEHAPSLSEQRLRSDLEAEAARINAAAPKRVDAMTMLERASVSDLTFTGHYALSLAGIEPADARLQMGRIVREGACADPGVAAAVRDGARFIYSYSSPKGRHLFDVAVTRCPAA